MEINLICLFRKMKLKQKVMTDAKLLILSKGNSSDVLEIPAKADIENKVHHHTLYTIFVLDPEMIDTKDK